MRQEFSVETSYEDFPTIFWTPKFHKNPIKFRLIAGSRGKILSPLEQIVGKLLKHISGHFENYCRVAERQTSFRHYFVIKNSGDLLGTLRKLKGKARTFDSFDFSNLYTNFRHGEIMERIGWLIDLMLNHAGKVFISVNKTCTKVEYTDTPYDLNAGWSFSADKFKDAVSFLIHNTYIEFGSFFLCQMNGIPMGSIPAPDIANLCLSVDEFRFVKSCLKNKNFTLLRKLNEVVRYLDDIGSPNFPDFDRLISLIYSDSLTLTRSNEISNTVDVAYLDLSISVIGSEYVVKVYCKTDDYNFEVICLPFLESNVAIEMCYYVYFGQILRFLRICTRLEDFTNRCIFLTSMLQRRGYDNDRLAKKFLDVIFRYRKECLKFGQFFVRDIMQEIVYRIQ